MLKNLKIIYFSSKIALAHLILLLVTQAQEKKIKDPSSASLGFRSFLLFHHNMIILLLVLLFFIATLHTSKLYLKLCKTCMIIMTAVFLAK